ncbi:unnamed protein product [Taenia asiatica]|uniref:Uncharacterized protein n=1 Tax=Taenia asiatica TaxID=60517 RepID=A0A0R3W3R8_TAEAS|nr:unnamed protein product [Taenia asiatica]
MGSECDRGQTDALGARLPCARTNRRHTVHTRTHARIRTHANTATLAPQYVPRVVRVCAWLSFSLSSAPIQTHTHTRTHTHLHKYSYTRLHSPGLVGVSSLEKQEHVLELTPSSTSYHSC